MTAPRPGLRLRPPEPAEGVRLGAVLAAMEPWRSLGFSAAALTRYLERDDPALRRMVIERAGQPAGVIALRTPWLRGPSIELLAVMPEAQGSGLGRALVDWAAGEAASTGNLWACVSAFNAPARAFWARAGFAEVAVLPELVAPGQDEILLRRRL